MAEALSINFCVSVNFMLLLTANVNRLTQHPCRGWACPSRNASENGRGKPRPYASTRYNFLMFYVMEFKYVKCLPGTSEEDKSEMFEKALDEAMAQISDKGYAAKYKGSGKAIYQAAFVFLGRGEIEMVFESQTKYDGSFS